MMADIRSALAFTLATRTMLAVELAAWRRLGVRPRLWWRDDDARRPSHALDRLLTLAHGRPLALAVIPDGDLPALAIRLATSHNVSPGQHGVDHVNRRTRGPRSEYPTPPSVEALRARISAGHGRMLEAGLSPGFYTPPWNVVEPALAPALASLGVPLLSAGAVPPVQCGLTYASAEIDVLSWKRGGAFKGAGRVMSAVRRALADRRRRGDLRRPIGLLTHHLDHDVQTWRFLERALLWFDGHFDWIGVDDLATASHHAPEGPAPPRAPMAHPPAV